MSRAAPVVYLAGPITGHSYGHATDWREKAKAELQSAGIIVFNPMRGKVYLSGEKAIDGRPEAYQRGSPLSRMEGIVTRDRFDCRTADLVLMNLLPAEEQLEEIRREVMALLKKQLEPNELAVEIDRLYNSGRGVVSIGTMIEAGWTDLSRVPLVIVLTPENPHSHALLVGVAGYRVETIEEGIALAKAILLP